MNEMNSNFDDKISIVEFSEVRRFPAAAFSPSGSCCCMLLLMICC